MFFEQEYLVDLSMNVIGTFSRLIPLAHQNNTRLILLNRRDYPGSTPYTDEERAMVANLTPDADDEALARARERLHLFLKDRAREVYDFLEELVRRDDIPPARRDKNTGGIAVAGWSLGALWATSLLAYAPLFPVNDIELAQYVRRVIVLGENLVSLGLNDIRLTDGRDRYRKHCHGISQTQ